MSDPETKPTQPEQPDESESVELPPVPGMPSPQDLLQQHRREPGEVIEVDADGRIVRLSPELHRQVQAPFN